MISKNCFRITVKVSFEFFSHPSRGKILIFLGMSPKQILIQAAAVIVSAPDQHRSVGKDNVWQVCYNA